MPDDGADAVVALTEQARSELRLKQFKLQSTSIEQALLRAHQRGVRVRVMLNPHTSGGDRWNDAAYALLQGWGIAVQWTSESFPVTHEKSMVIDNASVLIATFNLSDKYFNETRDYGVVSHDPAVVEQVSVGFEADWHRQFFEPRLDVGLVWSSAHSRGQMAKVIDRAHKTLWIQHPKFVDAVILERVVAARARGVKQILLATFPPVRAGIRGSLAAPYITPVNTGVRNLAVEKGVTLVDLYEAMRGEETTLIGDDGLHPTVAGYRRMAETFLNAIKQQFELASPPSLVFRLR